MPMSTGNIGWQARAGSVPRRLRRPHAGAGVRRLCLERASPLDDMPGEFNPERGWIASAHQMRFRSPGRSPNAASAVDTPDRSRWRTCRQHAAEFARPTAAA